MPNNTIFTLPRSVTIPKSLETKNKNLSNAVCQAVAIPVLQTRLSPKRISPSPFSVCQDSTLFLTYGTVREFAERLRFKSGIMASIDNEISRSFVSSTRLVLTQVLHNIDHMTDIKVLFDRIGSCTIAEIQAISNNFEYLFMQTMDLFMSCLRESLQAQEPDALDTVKKNALLEIKNLQPILKKFVDPSQSLDGLMDTVARVFDIDPFTIKIRQDYTPSVVYQILNRNLKLIPGSLQFETPQARKMFIEKEQSKLTSFITVFKLSYPEVTLNYSNQIIPDGIINLNLDQSLLDYKILVKLCLIHDLQSPPRQLSKQSRSILNECGILWGIHDGYREIALLDELVTRVENGDSSVAAVKTVMMGICKMDVGLMPISDKRYLGMVFKKLRGVLEDIMHQLISGDSDGSILYDVVDMLVEVLRYPIKADRSNDNEINRVILDDLKISIKKRAEDMRKSIDEDDQIAVTIYLFQLFNRDLLLFKEFFPKPICGGRFIWKMAAEEYLMTVNSGVKEISDNTDNYSGLLEIYDQAKKVITLCAEAELPPELFIPIENFFLPALESWLEDGEMKWNQWATRAFELDSQNQFQPINTMRNMNSNSVMDLFTAFQSTRSFLQKFEFKDLEKREMLKRKFLKGIHNTLSTYCELLFEGFQTFHNTKIDKAMEFKQEHVIKFNNVMYAYQLCNELIEKMDDLDSESSGPLNMCDEDAENGKFKERASPDSFKIKIIGARNLEIQNFTTPDSYCEMTLDGETVGTTPIVRSNCNPFWHAEQIVTLPPSLNTESLAFLHFEIFHDNPFGNEISCGKCAVFLKDPSIQNYLSHNVVKTLRPQGSIYLRIRREGEVNNTQWYIVRTMEVLKFTLEDMVWTFTNQITRMLRDYIANICKMASSKSFFGVAVQKGSNISSAVVEEQFLPLFAFIDKTLALLNQYVDRRFESTLKDLYPEAFSSSGDAMTSAGFYADDAIFPTLNVSRKSTKTSKAERDHAFVEPMIDYQKPPILINVIWHEVLKLCSSLLDGLVSEALSESQLQIVKLVDVTVELMKSIFYCKIARTKGSRSKENLGLSLRALETLAYRKLRVKLLDLLPRN